MIVRFVGESVRRSPKRKALMIAAIAMGAAVATSMLGVMLGIGDKINRELRTAGANITVTPASSNLTGGVGVITANATGGTNFLPEDKVLKIKSIFWSLNITGLSPALEATDHNTPIQGVWFRKPYKGPNSTDEFAGVRPMNPNWQLEAGRWAEDSANQCMAGTGLARRNHWKPGSDIPVLGATCQLTGILSAGDETDDTLLLTLAQLQTLTKRPGQVDRIQVAALTKPEDDFARKDPTLMTRVEYDRWYCTAYVTSIAKQIEEVIPGARARAVRRVADAEGKVLDKIGGLMALITLAALLSAGLTVWSITATTMMERRSEVAVMRAIGSSTGGVAFLFGLEIALIGLVGGVIGTATGIYLARIVSQSVFHDQIEISAILPLIILAASILVALLGALQPLRRALQTEPAVILRGAA